MAETIPRWHLPAVEFLETDAETIKAEIITGYEQASGRTLAAGDPVRLYLLSLAAVIIQQRTAVNLAAQQNLLSYAQDGYLDALGTLLSVTRVCYDRQEHKLTVTIEGTEIVFNRQDGSITVPNAVTINCTTATVNASSSVTLDTPKTDITGVLNVAGLITGNGGLAVSGGGGAAVTVSGNMSLQGQIDASSDVVAGGISLMTHTHKEQGDGSPLEGGGINGSVHCDAVKSSRLRAVG